jgi:hypothetical protein
MVKIIPHMEALAEASDAIGRRRIMDSLHRLAYSMETPEDTRDRFGFLVRNLAYLWH